MGIYHWPFCSFCNYWKGRNESTYLENSEWYADINNDRIVNDQHKQNMASLNKYMATYATQDTVVQPRDLDQPSWILHCSYYVGQTFKSGISLHAMPMLPSPGSVLSPIACLLQCRSGTNVSQWEPPVPEAVMPQLTAVMPRLN